MNLNYSKELFNKLETRVAEQELEIHVARAYKVENKTMKKRMGENNKRLEHLLALIKRIKTAVDFREDAKLPRDIYIELQREIRTGTTNAKKPTNCALTTRL